MKIIGSLALLLITAVSFGQTSYLDKGTGSEQSLKLGAKAMELLSENNLDAIWPYCSPNAKIDTTEIEAAGTLISEEYQATESIEPVMFVRKTPNGVYDRTFYQMKEEGRVLYLLQVKIVLAEENGNAVISSIKSLTGPAIRKSEKLIKGGGPEEKEAAEPKEKRVSKQSKADEEEE